MARWALYTGWKLYTGQLCRKYKATENFGKLSSDHNIQGDCYIQGRYIQVWLYYPFKGPLKQEGAHIFPTLQPTFTSISKFVTLTAFWVRFCIFFVFSLLAPPPPPFRRFNSPLLMVTNKILFFFTEDRDTVNNKFVLAKLFAFEYFGEIIRESIIILNPADQLIFNSNMKKSNCTASYSKGFLRLYN